MTQDCVVAGEGQSVMHQPRLETQSPEWRGAQLVRRCLSAVLHNSISRTHVMQQEVAVRMDDLVAQGGGHGELPLVNHGPYRSRGNCGYVADSAADGAEQLSADLSICSGCLRGIARNDFGPTHEAGK